MKRKMENSKERAPSPTTLKNAAQKKQYQSPNKLSNIVFLSNGYLSSPKSLVFVFEQKRILVNCGEGTQRLIYSNSIRMRHIDSILLTRFDWQCAGGLRGLSMGMLDTVAQANASAAENSGSSKPAARSQHHQSHQHRMAPVRIHCPVDLHLDNEGLSLKKHLVEKAFALEQFDYGQSSCDESRECNVRRFEMTENKEVWSYLLTIPKPLPNIDVDKLKALGVKQGPWVNEIIKGNDVTLENNRVIKASELLNTSNSYDRNVLIIDCNSLGDLEAVRETVEKVDLHLVIHMASSKLINDPSYIEWMRAHVKNDACIHMYMDETVPNIDLMKIYRLQAKLNLVNDECFKLLPMQTSEWDRQFAEAREKEKRLREKLKLIQVRSGMVFHLKPRIQLELNEQEQKIDNEESQNEIFSYYEKNAKIGIDGIEESEKKILDKIREKISKRKTTEISKVPEKYPNVLFLGTASACPNQTRNISSILLNLSPSKSIIMDCSESTVIQINKYYADETSFNEALCRIKAIFISHAHLDHYFGLFGLIKRRQEAFARLNLPYEQVTLMYPRNLNQELRGVAGLFFRGSFSELNSLAYLIQNNSASEQKLNQFKASLGIKSFKNVLVDHIPYAYACVIEMNDGFKLAYSGDCRPSEELAKEGKNANILIHECTFDDSFEAEAKFKNHSTISEALSVSQQMNAKCTLLTHFSQRYHNLPRVDDILIKEKAEKNHVVCVAFDFMKCDENFAGSDVTEMLKEMKVVFREHVDDLEQVLEKKKIKDSNDLNTDLKTKSKNITK